ncbi:MAG: hypothetical protein KL863_27385 [Rhizobium sp.]|nr:hypothetical protein [Rhizobium sp.]
MRFVNSIKNDCSLIAFAALRQAAIPGARHDRAQASHADCAGLETPQRRPPKSAASIRPDPQPNMMFYKDNAQHAVLGHGKIYRRGQDILNLHFLSMVA